MKTTFYAILTRKGLDRTCKTNPATNLRMGEYAVKVNLDIPDEVFRPPIPTASIVVPDMVAPEEAPIVSLEDVCDGITSVEATEDGEITAYVCDACGQRSTHDFRGPHFKPGAF